MKKSRTIIMTILPILMLVAVMFITFAPTVMGAYGDVDDILNQGSGTGIGTVNNAVGKAWSTILLILQIAAVAAIVIAGVRYMFASADQKADIKKGMIGLVIGAILVFAASTVVQFIINATKQVAGEPITSSLIKTEIVG